jgi:DNA-binding protein YbaB
MRGAKPSLTVNEVREHCLHIINEAKQNKASVKYRPVGGGATAESAEVYEGIYRHIVNVSNAQMAQGQAIGFQVQAGLGFTLIETDYIEASPRPNEDAFNQEIYIRGCSDPMSVMLDCDAAEPDASDARYGFVFTDRPKDAVQEQYPELKYKLATANAVDGADAGWIREDHVREAVYYEVTEDRDELLGDDAGTVVFASKVPKDLQKQWEQEHEERGSSLKRRPIIRKSVKSHLIIGNDLVKTTDIPGTSVPIIPWCGEVTVIDRIMDRKGHARALISAQQMTNYNWSASVEFGALQSKSPWIAPVAAMGDYMSYYQTANVENHSVLPWIHRDEEGRDIPKPERMQPPTGAPVYLEGVQMAREFMQAASGQYEAMMGQQGNERSGRAINERQRMGDRATYHYIDAQALAVRRQGQIIMDWVPVIYDTARVQRIIAADNSEGSVQIDPDAAEAHHIKAIGDAITRIFNPKVGSYEVVSDTGPDYATERQEAFAAIKDILVRAPDLVNKIGDLLFKVADFPLADEIAERLKPGLPPEAQAAVTELQKQLQKQNKTLAEAMQSLAEERLRVKAKDAKVDVDAFDADTRRLGVVKDMIPMDPEAMARLIRETVRQALQDNLGPVRGSSAVDLETVEMGQPPPGAQVNGVPQQQLSAAGSAATPGG